MSSPPELLPLFVDVRDVRVVVTGGGPSAASAARRLAGAGARVRAVARDVSLLRDALVDAECDFVEETPDASHLAGCLLVVAASDEPEDDDAILRAADERGVLGVAGTAWGGMARAHLGTGRFEGRVGLAATTASRCPELEERLAAEAARPLVPEHDRLAEILAGLRRKLEERYPDEERRRQIWQQVLDSPVLPLLQSGDEEEAAELAERMAWGTG